MNPIVLTDHDLQRIQCLGGDDLARLYQALTTQLRGPAALGNSNAVTTRLPMEACHAVNRFALKHRITRSEVVREAVLRFVAAA